MNFEDPKLKILPNQPPKGIEAVNEEMRQKAEDFVRPLVQELSQQSTEEPDKKLFAVEQIATFGKRVFQGHEDVLDAVLTKINAIPFTSDEEFEEILVRELGGALLAFVASSGFSEQEAKIYFRRFREEREGNTPLDTDLVLSYSRFEEKIDLHITYGFTIPLFKECMSKLAEIVRSDESIKTIKMTSWVVAKYKNAVKRFGFTIDEPLSEAVLAEIRPQLPAEMRDKPIAEAHTTREDFLARYGVEK